MVTTPCYGESALESIFPWTLLSEKESSRILGFLVLFSVIWIRHTYTFDVQRSRSDTHAFLDTGQLSHTCRYMYYRATVNVNKIRFPSCIMFLRLPTMFLPNSGCALEC